MVKQGEKRINKEKILSRQEKEERKEIPVDFTYHSPEARHQVYLVGEFNNWDVHSIPMRKTTDQEWKATIALHPGRYEYKYFADDFWVDDGPGAEKSQNSYGSNNMVIHIN